MIVEVGVNESSKKKLRSTWAEKLAESRYPESRGEMEARKKTEIAMEIALKMT